MIIISASSLVTITHCGSTHAVCISGIARGAFQSYSHFHSLQRLLRALPVLIKFVLRVRSICKLASPLQSSMVKRKKPNTHQQSLGDELENPATYGVRARPPADTTSALRFHITLTLVTALDPTHIGYAGVSSARQEAERRPRWRTCEAFLSYCTSQLNFR